MKVNLIYYFHHWLNLDFTLPTITYQTVINPGGTSYGMNRKGS